MADSFIPESTKPETSEAVELLPCPFCASSDAEMQPVLVRDQHGPCVICPACSAVGAVRDSQAEAIAAWNTRAALSAPPAGQNVERMREACAAAPDHADIMETIENAADDWQAKGYPTALAEVRDMADVGRALMEALPEGYHYIDCPSEIVADLQNERDEALAAAPSGATPADEAGVRDMQHVAYFDEGSFHWMSGIRPRDCELYARWPSAASPKAPSVAIGAGEVACPKCGGEWCSVDLCLPATPSKTGSPSATVERESWTGNPHGLASELRRVANLWRKGFKLPQLLRDAADEIDCLAHGNAPPSASIPADVEREAEESPYVAGPIWAEEEDDCFTGEVQIVGGHYLVATVHGGTRDEVERRQAAVIAALAARPSTPQANDAPSILDRTPRTHPYKPHAKFPWFCDVCGYAEHERLQHPAPATPQANDGTSIPDGEERA